MVLTCSFTVLLQAMESKESLMKVLDEQTDISAQLKQAWKADNVQEMQNFMVLLFVFGAYTCV